MALVYIGRKLKRGQRGQALVELALVVPVLLMLVLGIFEFGRLLNAYMTVQHAAREGARLGILGATDVEIETVVVSTAATTLDTTRLTVVISPPVSSRTSGVIMTVSVTYTFEIIVPLFDRILGSSVPITSNLSMRVE